MAHWKMHALYLCPAFLHYDTLLCCLSKNLKKNADVSAVLVLLIKSPWNNDSEDLSCAAALSTVCSVLFVVLQARQFHLCSLFWQTSVHVHKINLSLMGRSYNPSASTSNELKVHQCAWWTDEVHQFMHDLNVEVLSNIFCTSLATGSEPCCHIRDDEEVIGTL